MADSTEYLREIALNIEQLAKAIVDEMIARGIGLGGGGGSGGGGAYASAANQVTTIERITEIRDRLSSTTTNTVTSSNISQSIGSTDSPTATDVNDGYGNTISWNIISLLRGALSHLIVGSTHLNTLVNVAYNINRRGHSSNISISDFSGVIGAAYTSYPYPANYERRYLFIQNLPIEPTGNLWFNFGDEAQVNNGSIFLSPGESFTLEGSAVISGGITILGTVAGMNFTYKEG